MKTSSNSTIWIVAVCLLVYLWLPAPNQADAADAWWDEAWPYRLPVTINGSGVAEVSINFTTAFNSLGLHDALLDVRSIRVIPYNGTTPGTAIAYDETYSTILNNAETTAGWSVNDDTAAIDNTRYTQGGNSVKATIFN